MSQKAFILISEDLIKDDEKVSYIVKTADERFAVTMVRYGRIPEGAEYPVVDGVELSSLGGHVLTFDKQTIAQAVAEFVNGHVYLQTRREQVTLITQKIIDLKEYEGK